MLGRGSGVVAEADLLPLKAADDAYAPTRAGAKLREARERMGLSRTELSIRTKINERHLAAVEDSDFAALPARIYAVGFARSYAGAVGLEPSAIAAEVRRDLVEHERPVSVRPAYDLDIEDPAALADVLKRAGADASGFAAFAAGDGPRELAAVQEAAEAKGVFGVPSFLFADGDLYWGREHLSRIREILAA